MAFAAHMIFAYGLIAPMNVRNSVLVDRISLSAEIGLHYYAMDSFFLIWFAAIHTVHLPVNANQNKYKTWMSARWPDDIAAQVYSPALQWAAKINSDSEKRKIYQLWENRCRRSPWAIRLRPSVRNWKDGERRLKIARWSTIVPPFTY